MSKYAGYFVAECAEDFEQVLGLDHAPHLPVGGILTWTSGPRALFTSRLSALQAQQPRAQAVAELPDDDSEFQAPAEGFTCFHCGTHFASTPKGIRAAREHFGERPSAPPDCVVVPKALPFAVLGEAAIAGVFETGNPKHGWDYLLSKVGRPCTHPQPLALPEVPEGFYLASFKGPLRDEVLWWGENDRGYTTDLSEAGVYTEIKPNYHDSEHTVPVPVAFVGAQHTRRVLSRAYQGNTSWRSADTLRKEIESYRARLMAKAVPND